MRIMMAALRACSRCHAGPCGQAEAKTCAGGLDANSRMIFNAVLPQVTASADLARGDGRHTVAGDGRPDRPRRCETGRHGGRANASSWRSSRLNSQTKSSTFSKVRTSTRPDVGNPQFGDDHQRQQRVLHVGVVEGAAAGAHGGDHAGRPSPRRSRRARPTSGRRSAARPAPAPGPC